MQNILAYFSYIFLIVFIYLQLFLFTYSCFLK